MKFVYGLAALAVLRRFGNLDGIARALASTGGRYQNASLINDDRLKELEAKEKLLVVFNNRFNSERFVNA